MIGKFLGSLSPAARALGLPRAGGEVLSSVCAAHIHQCSQGLDDARLQAEQPEIRMAEGRMRIYLPLSYSLL